MNKTANTIKIVTPDWLIDSVRGKSVYNECLYHPRLLVFPKSSSPSSTSKIYLFENAIIVRLLYSSRHFFFLAHITGFDDFDSTAPTTSEVKDNVDLEQLKQRLPWNQPPSSADALGPENAIQVHIFKLLVDFFFLFTFNSLMNITH